MSPPLDQRHAVSENPQTGQQEKIPLLHPKWKQPVQFVLYQAPPLDQSDAAVFGEWVERCSFLEDDLHWLLQLPHDKFWCQVIFDETLQRCIDSYLNLAPRSHDVYQDLPADTKAKHQTIHRLFFMTCLRMATYKESKDCHLTPSVFGEIIYENFIFDIPKIMDMCVLFSRGNSAIISKMVENIFDQQPKYVDDLQAVVPTILEVFDGIQKKCGLKVDGSFTPQKLSAHTGPRSALLSLPLTEFQDIVLYLTDTCATLAAFLEVYPRGALAFRDQDFPNRLVTMYENLVPALKEALKGRDWSHSAVRPLLAKKVRSAQHHLLLIFRQIVFQSFLQPAIDNSSPEEVEEVVEAYVHLMTFVLGEQRFAANYDYLFPFMEDQDLLSQTSYSIDDMRVEFLEQGFSESRAAHRPHQKSAVSAMSTTAAASSGMEGGAATADSAYYQAPDTDEDVGACAPRVTGVELESLITSVHDLLPYLGEGFIEVALEEFGYDVERVINSVLEDRLPASLLEVDRSLPRQTKVLTEEDVLSQRANVFDNDEFDVFNRTDVDVSRIHKGKKEKGLDMALLNEKDELASVKPLFERYGAEDRPSMYDNLAEYDDEYDDTYDANNIGAADADDADDLRERKSFVVPRILAAAEASRHRAERVQEYQESDEEEGGNTYTRRPDNFVEDPAKVRERAEQRRLSKQNRSSKRPPAQQPQGQQPQGQQAQGQQAQGQQPQGQQPQGQKRFDVVGKAKGQGQDSNVLRNRAFKEKNKNKSHRNQADKKRKI